MSPKLPAKIQGSYPPHMRRYIAQLNNAEQRRAAMTPNLRGQTHRYNLRSAFGAGAPRARGGTTRSTSSLQRRRSSGSNALIEAAARNRYTLWLQNNSSGSTPPQVTSSRKKSSPPPNNQRRNNQQPSGTNNNSDVIVIDDDSDDDDIFYGPHVHPPALIPNFNLFIPPANSIQQADQLPLDLMALHNQFEELHRQRQPPTHTIVRPPDDGVEIITPPSSPAIITIENHPLSVHNYAGSQPSWSAFVKNRNPPARTESPHSTAAKPSSSHTDGKLPNDQYSPTTSTRRTKIRSTNQAEAEPTCHQQSATRVVAPPCDQYPDVSSTSTNYDHSVPSTSHSGQNSVPSSSHSQTSTSPTSSHANSSMPSTSCNYQYPAGPSTSNAVIYPPGPSTSNPNPRIHRLDDEELPDAKRRRVETIAAGCPETGTTSIISIGTGEVLGLDGESLFGPYDFGDRIITEEEFREARLNVLTRQINGMPDEPRHRVIRALEAARQISVRTQAKIFIAAYQTPTPPALAPDFFFAEFEVDGRSTCLDSNPGDGNVVAAASMAAAATMAATASMAAAATMVGVAGTSGAGTSGTSAETGTNKADDDDDPENIPCCSYHSPISADMEVLPENRPPASVAATVAAIYPHEEQQHGIPFIHVTQIDPNDVELQAIQAIQRFQVHVHCLVQRNMFPQLARAGHLTPVDYLFVQTMRYIFPAFLMFPDLLRESQHRVRDEISENRLEILNRICPIRSVQYRDLNEKCVICQCNLERGQKIRALLCEHKYHAICIDTWCRTALTCPVCRRGIDGQELPDEIIRRYPPFATLRSLEFIRAFLVMRRYSYNDNTLLHYDTEPREDREKNGPKKRQD